MHPLLLVGFPTVATAVISLSVLWFLLRSAKEAHRSDLDANAAHIRAEYESQLVAARSISQDEEKRIRKDAIQRSQSTITGQVAERLCPYFDDFIYNPRDMRFFGDPFDFIVMPGYSTGKVEEVVILEIKSGKGSLNSRQRQIRNCVDEGRVRWDMIHLDVNTKVDDLTA